MPFIRAWDWHRQPGRFALRHLECHSSFDVGCSGKYYFFFQSFQTRIINICGLVSRPRIHCKCVCSFRDGFLRLNDRNCPTPFIIDPPVLVPKKKPAPKLTGDANGSGAADSSEKTKKKRVRYWDTSKQTGPRQVYRTKPCAPLTLFFF